MTVERTKKSFAWLVMNVIASAAFFPAVILLLGGNIRWVEGWLFAGWFDVMLLFNIIYLYWKDPALLGERTRAPGSGNQKTWDKYLLVFVFAAAILWLVSMPLDAQRFHWSPAFPLWLKITGGVLLIPALYLIERTTIENTFLSTLVRIQGERKQRVITTGVYSFVRHPLYLGCLLMMVGAPLMVGSIYALVIAALGTAALSFRIVGEEKMLAEELDGYAEYRQKVKYRLIPFIW